MGKSLGMPFSEGNEFYVPIHYFFAEGGGGAVDSKRSILIIFN